MEEEAPMMAGGPHSGVASLGLPRRVATISVHTSPLDQPGAGDAGGLNVAIAEVARRMAEQGVEVDIFTRATARAAVQAPIVQMCPGVRVRHIPAGPRAPLDKDDLPGQLLPFSAAMLRAAAGDRRPYDVAHSHYWLSGQVGWMARQHWDVPLIHSAHTLAKVKNASLALGDLPESSARIAGEEHIVCVADRLVAATADERRQLHGLYGADPARTIVIPPGVDLRRFRLASASTARTRLGIPPDALVLLFVGRIQPLKGPDVLLRAVAALLFDPRGGDAAARAELARRLRVLVVGAPSGSGLRRPEAVEKLSAHLGIADAVRFIPPVPPAELADYYRAADLTAVPSHSESFGLVALESQACGTPVVAAAVGGLPTAIADGESGVLVHSHDPGVWARVLRDLLLNPRRRAALAGAARGHAERFSWAATASSLLGTYRAAIATRRAAVPRVAPRGRLAGTGFGNAEATLISTDAAARMNTDAAVRMTAEATARMSAEAARG
jgi:D-inositol-3-phosphate glycosyltransferase